MKALSKSEWFELDSPIGEPEVKWTDATYVIERIVRENGKILWMGYGTNWVKNPNEGWTKLTTDESVKPNADGVYPENRSYFAPCDLPIYEVLYQQLRAKNNELFMKELDEFNSK